MTIAVLPLLATLASTAGTAGVAGAALSGFQIASLAFSAGSTILGAIGQKNAADASASQDRYNAAIQRNNEIIAGRNADDAIKRGDIAEKQHRLKIAQLKGSQKAAIGASGIEVDSGSPLDILSDTAEIGELEALTIRNNAEREADGFRTQASNFGASSQNSLLSASNTESAGNLGFASSLIGGAGAVSDKYYRYKKGF